MSAMHLAGPRGHLFARFAARLSRFISAIRESDVDGLEGVIF